MENNALRACIESKTVKKKIQISSPIPLFSNREFQNKQFSIKVQNQPPNFWKSPGWNLSHKSFKSSRKFNNTITLKSNKACWSFTFLRNQTIYAITLSTAIISYEAINIHSVVPRTLTKTIIKKGHQEDTGHDVCLYGASYSRFTQTSSFILKIAFLCPQLITFNCKQHLIQVRMSFSETVFTQAKGHTEHQGTFIRLSQHTGKNL